MKVRINFLPLTIFLCATLAFGYLEANAQPTYLPVGPQTDVPVATVTGGGWTECYRDIYAVNMDADTVLSDCPDELLMLSCRGPESDTLTLLAQGNRSDVTFDTGNDNTDETHIANGVGWYFNNILNGELGAAWGFVRAGDSVNKTNCDGDDSGANDERLCWHLNGVGGWRCGETQGLNSSESWERIVYMASSPQQFINLSPTTATNDVGTDHTVTATVDTDGVPEPDVLVTFEVTSGPNAGLVSIPNNGECTPNDDCTTDGNGQVSWTYSSLIPGTDIIVASFTDPAGVVIESNTVEKIWETVPIPTLSQWGLIAMAGILGLVGFIVMRRRKVSA